MDRVALFPGTFDPLTLGHMDIIQRVAGLFSKVFVGVGNNCHKRTIFPPEQRRAWIERSCKSLANVQAVIYSGLTVNCCREIGANYIVRGIRYLADFEYEKSIADTNYVINKNIETVIFPSRPEYYFISSTIVRDILLNGGDISKFVPKEILADLQDADVVRK